MEFKQAWRAAGNLSPGNTSWSADVAGRPVFTAWRERDLEFNKKARRSQFYSPPGDWIKRGEGQSYLRRATEAMSKSWLCRLIWLEGRDPWEHAASADFDDRFYAVRFTEVKADGTIRGELFTCHSFQDLANADGRNAAPSSPMKEKSNIPPLPKQEKEFHRLAVDIGWYMEENWTKVKAASIDPEQFENTYREWTAMAEKVFQDVLVAGDNAEKININSDELLAWCLEHHKPNSAGSRAEFVSQIGLQNRAGAA